MNAFFIDCANASKKNNIDTLKKEGKGRLNHEKKISGRAGKRVGKGIIIRITFVKTE